MRGEGRNVEKGDDESHAMLECAMQGLELTIFLSGTMKDLREERTAIRTQIGSPLYEVVAAEDWGARYRPPRDLCIRAVRESDVYLGLYGGRYGWKPPGDEISVTEWEFNTAREAGKPVLVYIRQGRKGPKQRAFLARVSDFNAGYNRRPEFESCEQLVSWVKEDLVTLMEDLVEESENNGSATRDPLIYVKCRLNLAFLAREDGQWEQAEHHYQWILNQGVWNETAHDLALHELQILYVAGKLWEEAIEVIWRSIDLLPLMGLPADDLRGREESLLQELAQTYILWARSDSDLGNLDGAVDAYKEAERIYQRIGDWESLREIRFALAETYERWAKMRISVRQLADAVRHYQSALELYEKLERPARIALIWYRLGQLRKEQRREREALNCFEKSLMYRKGNNHEFLVPYEIVLSAHDEIVQARLRRRELHHAVSQLCEKADDLINIGLAQNAVVTAQEALRLSDKIQDRKLILASRCRLGRALEEGGRPEQAMYEYQMALDLADVLGDEHVRYEIVDRLDRLRKELSRRYGGYEYTPTT